MWNKYREGKKGTKSLKMILVNTNELTGHKLTNHNSGAHSFGLDRYNEWIIVYMV